MKDCMSPEDSLVVYCLYFVQSFWVGHDINISTCMVIRKWRTNSKFPHSHDSDKEGPVSNFTWFRIANKLTWTARPLLYPWSCSPRTSNSHRRTISRLPKIIIILMLCDPDKHKCPISANNPILSTTTTTLNQFHYPGPRKLIFFLIRTEFVTGLCIWSLARSLYSLQVLCTRIMLLLLCTLGLFTLLCAACRSLRCLFRCTSVRVL